jgi:hypothetical protein
MAWHVERIRPARAECVCIEEPYLRSKRHRGRSSSALRTIGSSIEYMVSRVVLTCSLLTTFVYFQADTSAQRSQRGDLL